MISDKLQQELNIQINEELFSSYLYLAMSAWFESVNLHGFAHWMRVQAREENAHAEKFYKYIVERGGRVILKAIAEPKVEWASPLAAFEAAYSHERHITSRIYGLVDAATLEKDHATTNFLQYFVKEQVEEEASADGVVQILKMVGESTQGLFLLDRQLAARS